MRPQLCHASLYAAFDRFPSAKGAGIHIGHMANTLFDAAGSGQLCVLGGEDLPEYQREGTVEIFRFDRRVPNLLERTIAFSHMVGVLTRRQRASLRLCQFRDPWSGIPIISDQARDYAAIYEINGLPSIELACAYPSIAASTLAKIRTLERECWTAADAVITPSETMKSNLAGLGVPAGKIVVIPNGAELRETPARPADAPGKYLLYFGAMQRWQGVDVLLRAFALLADFDDLALVIVSSNPPRYSKGYARLAEKLGVAPRVHWRFALPQRELAAWVANAAISIAPLTECARNLQQGCCPLKIVESMAAGVALVASDLPSVRELLRDGIEGKLVRPGRPSELARAIRVLLEYPDEMRRLGVNARDRIRQRYTWTQSESRLRQLYATFLNGSARFESGQPEREAMASPA